MVSQLQDKGEIRNFHTIVRGQFGSTEDVEVSAVAVTEGETPCFGFALHRSAARRQVSTSRTKVCCVLLTNSPNLSARSA